LNSSNNKKLNKETIWFILSKIGFNDWKRNGENIVLINKNLSKTIKLPVEKKEIDEVELKSILSTAGINFEKFKDIYKKWDLR